MKRLLYVAFKDFDNLHFGANAKVLSQCRAFQSYGYTVDLIGRQGTNTVLIRNGGEPQILRQHKSLFRNKRIENLFAKQYQIQDIIAHTNNLQYDACYIRYDFSDHGFISLLKVLRKHCGKIALELPTYPYEEENSSGFLSKAKISIDLHFRKQLVYLL